MNENRIQQVIEIEKQAQQVLDSAKHDAEQLPILADQEAQVLLEKARADAQEKARQMINNAQSVAETVRIISDAEEKAREMEKLALKNFDRAVAFVLDQLIGKG